MNSLHSGRIIIEDDDLHRIFRNQKVSGEKSRDEYWKYRESRTNHPEAKGYLILAAGFLVLSVGLIPFAMHA